MQDEKYKNRLVCYIASGEIFDICKFTIKYIIVNQSTSYAQFLTSQLSGELLFDRIIGQNAHSLLTNFNRLICP